MCSGLRKKSKDIHTFPLCLISSIFSICKHIFFFSSRLRGKKKEKSEIQWSTRPDPLSLVSSKQCFVFTLFSFAWFWDVRTYGRHGRKQWSLPAIIVGRPSGSKKWNSTRKMNFRHFPPFQNRERFSAFSCWPMSIKEVQKKLLKLENSLQYIIVNITLLTSGPGMKYL